MMGKRFKEEQIIGILKELEADININDFARKHAISDTTIYNWKAKFGGISGSEARRLKALEDENGKLKRIVADLTLDNQALKAVISKNF